MGKSDKIDTRGQNIVQKAGIVPPYHRTRSAKGVQGTAPARHGKMSFGYKLIFTVNLCLLVCLCLTSVTVAAMQLFGKTPNVTVGAGDYSAYKDLLSQEEQIEWQQRKARPGEASVNINQRILVQRDTGEGEINLQNPPYSAYTCKVDIVLAGEDGEEEIVFSSEKIIPGTVIQYAQFNKSFSSGEYAATAKYVFLDEGGAQRGTYETDISLVVE